MFAESDEDLVLKFANLEPYFRNITLQDFDLWQM